MLRTIKARLDEKTPFLCECSRCGGTGKVPHECDYNCIRRIELIYGDRSGSPMENLGIYVCLVCGQLWKIRNQYDPGTGSDNIWVRPGEKERGYDFPVSEARKYVEAAERILAAPTASS